jgi:hypothetical protein
MKIIENLMDWRVARKYYLAGINIGDAVSHIPIIGECDGFEKLFKKWELWEGKYAERGFRTISIDKFVEAGGYGIPIKDFMGQRLGKDEKPVFHAQRYREMYLGKVSPVVDLQALFERGEFQTGEYAPISTELGGEK